MTIEARPMPPPNRPSQFPFLSENYRARTDAEGRFDISRLPASAYSLGIGRAFPGQQRVEPSSLIPDPVTLGVAERLEVGDIALPPNLRVSSIRGTVRDAAGRAVKGAEVYVADAAKHQPLTEPARTDAGGRFQIAVPAGGRYVISAEISASDARRLFRATVDSFEPAAGDNVLSLQFPERPE
jgi:hypothetical protein